MSGTNTPAIQWNATGPIAPAESAILAGVLADVNAAFGGGLNTALTTPQGQLASSQTAIIGDKNDELLLLVNQVDPAYSSGRMQDAIGRIYFITRIPAQPTTVQATCSGAGVTIPTGALAKATDGNIYSCTAGGTIPAGGSIVLPFACTATGPIACPAGSLTTIYQSLPGWDSITNLGDGVLGNVVESRADFESRRSASVAGNSRGGVQAVLAAVLNVPNVLDAYVTDNATASPVTVGGQTIAANSLYVCVSGGDPNAVALAIWTKKAPGCAYTGNTTVTVTDGNSGYSLPAPTYAVTFQTPALRGVYISVVIANSALVPSNAAALVQSAVIAAFSGADGGQRARIGSTIYASRFYPNIAALGAWAQIVSINLGDVITAVFIGSISGTTLTVTSLISGAIAVGMSIGGTRFGASGTIITALGSGTGGAGTYTVNLSQTVVSGGINGVTLGNSVTLPINAVPTIAPANISLTLV